MEKGPVVCDVFFFYLFVFTTRDDDEFFVFFFCYCCQGHDIGVIDVLVSFENDK